ncbi:MAG: hypothetical protein II783_03845, partial [Erysipelotrichales bacterium]|nr:hypothetical protein [Erysipelotrichales bacterium]
FDIALDDADLSWHRRKLVSVVSEYVSEATYGDVLQILKEETGDSLLFEGKKEKTVFKMRFIFA